MPLDFILNLKMLYVFLMRFQFFLKKIRTKTYGPHCVCILMLCVEPKQHTLLSSDAKNTRCHPTHHKVAGFCVGVLAFC
jgi:hypothetical protein